jgi:hypothetical protein
MTTQLKDVKIETPDTDYLTMPEYARLSNDPVFLKFLQGIQAVKTSDLFLSVPFSLIWSPRRQCFGGTPIIQGLNFTTYWAIAEFDDTEQIDGIVDGWMERFILDFNANLSRYAVRRGVGINEIVGVSETLPKPHLNILKDMNESFRKVWGGERDSVSLHWDYAFHLPCQRIVGNDPTRIQYLEG